MRACVVLSLVLLSGCALNRGPGSYYQQWRDGSTGERALMVFGGVCMVGLLYLVYHVSTDDDDGGGAAITSTGRPCVGDDCAPPAPPRQCYMGRDEYGLPCW